MPRVQSRHEPPVAEKERSLTQTLTLTLTLTLSNPLVAEKERSLYWLGLPNPYLTLTLTRSVRCTIQRCTMHSAANA